jgi:hypothetical protein
MGSCQVKKMAAATEIVSYVHASRVDTSFDVALDSNPHDVWIQLNFLCNQAFILLIMPMFSTFLALVKQGLKTPMKYQNTQYQYQPSLCMYLQQLSRCSTFDFLKWLRPFQ